MADRDVTVDIIVRDDSDRATKSVIRNLKQVDDENKKAAKSNDKLTKALTSFRDKALTATKAVAKIAASTAAFGSLVGPATTGLLSAAKGAVVLAKGAASAASSMAPLVAFLPSLAGSAGLLAGTLKLIGPGFSKALQPVIGQFVAADKSTTKLTARLQSLATRGVQPLAQQFVKVNLPTIQKGMERIAVATDSVAVGVGKWINSVPGQKLIASITTATADAATRLAPKVTEVATAIGGLASRAGSGAIAALPKIVGAIADKFATWANSVSGGDIQHALDQISSGLDRLKAAWDRLKEFGGWLEENRPKIKAFSDTLGTLGITIGLLTGDWPAVAAAGLSLVANNWGTVKGVLQDFKGWLASSGITEMIQGLIDKFKPEFIENFKTSWNDLKTALKDNEPQLKLIFGDFAAILGAFITISPYLLSLAAGFVIFTGQVVRVVSTMVEIILAGFSTILHSAATAFGWVPGIGPKLKSASAEFDKFAAGFINGLNSIHDKTVTITIRKLGNGASLIDNQGQVRVTGNRNFAFAGGLSWAPAATAGNLSASFAGGSNQAGGTSRTGGPSPVHVESQVTSNLYLDGTLIYSRTDRALERERWRNRMVRR